MLENISFYSSLLGLKIDAKTKTQTAHVLVYGAVLIHHMGKKGCIASNETIGKETGLSKNTVANCISELNKIGLLKVVMKDGVKNSTREKIIPILPSDFEQFRLSLTGETTTTFHPQVKPLSPTGETPFHPQVNRDNNGENKEITNSKTGVLPSFDFQEELKKLLNPPENKVCRIVHWYVKLRKIECRTEKEWKEEKGRLFKSAKQLEGYSKKEMEYCIKYYQENKLSWTLETLARNAKLILAGNNL